MPTYDYSCRKCNTVREIVHPISEDPEYKCECGEVLKREISYNPTGFVFKGGTLTIHNREKDRRKQESIKRDARMRTRKSSGPSVKPNIAGVETDSWSDAQKMAKEAGMNHESYAPYVEKEKKSKIVS